MEKGKMHNIISAAIFAAIMAVLSQFTFPIGPVPITLQSFVCALAGGVLGRKWGAISIGVWLLLGLLGIPILTMGKAGAGIFLSPVGGYYLGFVVMAWVSGNREVAMWMDNLKRRKERYYRDNLEVILRIIPGYDKNTLIEAIRICLDKGIYNGDSVKSLCEYVCRGKENGTEIYGLEDRLPRQGGLIQSYNEILRDYDKT